MLLLKQVHYTSRFLYYVKENDYSEALFFQFEIQDMSQIIQEAMFNNFSTSISGARYILSLFTLSN
jgi:hypothetical protein